MGREAILFTTETVRTEYLSIKFSPRSYTEIGDMSMLEERKHDRTKARVNMSWAFYRKRNEDLEFVDRVEFENRAYNARELSWLITKAGWGTLTFFQKPFNVRAYAPSNTAQLSC